MGGEGRRGEGQRVCHREDMIVREILHPGGEALVEPEVVPPLHSDLS